MGECRMTKLPGQLDALRRGEVIMKKQFECPNKRALPACVVSVCIDSDCVPQYCLDKIPGCCSRADELRKRLAERK